MEKIFAEFRQKEKRNKKSIIEIGIKKKSVEGINLITVSNLIKINSLFLKHDVWVGFQIRHVDFLSILDDFWMFSNAQPTNVAEPKSSTSTMWIGISVTGNLMIK